MGGDEDKAPLPALSPRSCSRAGRCLLTGAVVGVGVLPPTQKLDGHFPELRPQEQGHPQH